jgi:hypothetical protein
VAPRTLEIGDILPCVTLQGCTDHVIIIAVVKRYQNELQADIISLTFTVSLPPFVSGQTSWELLPIMTRNMNKPRWPVLLQTTFHARIQVHFVNWPPVC